MTTPPRSPSPHTPPEGWREELRAEVEAAVRLRLSEGFDPADAAQVAAMIATAAVVRAIVDGVNAGGRP